MMYRIRICLLVLMSALLLLSGCGTKEIAVEEPQAEFNVSLDQLQRICKLSTFKCYVNNVAKTTLEGSFLQHDSTLWIEYDGTVDIGIDFSKMTLEADGDRLIIAIPDAEVLSVNDPELYEDSYYSSGQKLFSAKITAEDERKAFESAQENMKKSVSESTSLLLAAKTRAQVLIENYIHQMDELAGTSHVIVWKGIG